MSYHVRFSEKAYKQLSRLDRSIQKLIMHWLRKNLEGSEDPRGRGKALVGNHSGEWRYRVEGSVAYFV